MNLWSVWSVLRRRWLPAAACGLLIAAGGLALSVSHGPSFEARAVLLLRAPNLQSTPEGIDIEVDPLQAFPTTGSITATALLRLVEDPAAKDRLDAAGAGDFSVAAEPYTNGALLEAVVVSSSEVGAVDGLDALVAELGRLLARIEETAKTPQRFHFAIVPLTESRNAEPVFAGIVRIAGASGALAVICAVLAAIVVDTAAATMLSRRSPREVVRSELLDVGAAPRDVDVLRWGDVDVNAGVVSLPGTTPKGMGGTHRLSPRARRALARISPGAADRLVFTSDEQDRDDPSIATSFSTSGPGDAAGTAADYELQPHDVLQAASRPAVRTRPTPPWPQ